MENYNEEAQANAKVIASEIQSFESGHWDFFNRQYKDFWAHARKISEMFKTLKPLRRDDRERLWEKFNVYCQEIKQRQKTEHWERELKSKQHCSDIIHEAERARPSTLFGFFPPDVAEMKALGSILRNAGAMLSNFKEEMFGEHKQECFDRMQEIRLIHDLWWDELKQHRSKRQEESQERVRANLKKNYERHQKAIHALEKIRNHADDLRDQINSAWNDDFRDRAYGWLSETEEKIRDIEESIQKLEDWIREDEEKLR
jgi:hypothetical protein